MFRKSTLLTVALTLTLSSFLAGAWGAEKKPLKVFILTGQSNMVGMAKNYTLAILGDDPATTSLLKKIMNPDGSFKTVDGVWITNYQANQANDPEGEGAGPLTVGYGGRKDATQPGDNFGPELYFGITMREALNEPVLIIKTAWGGKSLYQDFRPPSSGPYKLNEGEVERIKSKDGDVAAEQAKRNEASGVYYRLMLGHVRNVLKDIGRVVPGYDASQGYELSGFAWFQGWNDMVNGGIYPQRGQPGGYDMYSDLLAQFIRDVRRDLKASELPFVIGVMGTEGPIENRQPRYQGIHGTFREAMAAPAALPEFKGNVIAVQTAPFWDMWADALLKKRDAYNRSKKDLANRVKKGDLNEDQAAKELKALKTGALTPEEEATLKRSVSNGGYHYLGSGKTMALIGQGFAEGVLELMGR